MERMQILIDNAISNARTDPELSQRQASIARRISSKYKFECHITFEWFFAKNVNHSLLQE